MLDLGPRRIVSFAMSGKPHAKQRPRFVKATGIAFTPGKTVSFEQTVRAIAVERFPEPITGPVRLTITARFQVAQSWPKKKQAALMDQLHCGRPDLDNIAKSITDGLSRVAFVDDAQVAETVCRKVWGERAETVVIVEAI